LGLSGAQDLKMLEFFFIRGLLIYIHPKTLRCKLASYTHLVLTKKSLCPYSNQFKKEG